jgi:hypothetical protein
MDDNLAAVVITALLSGSILLGLLGRALFSGRRRKSVDSGDTIVPDRLRAIEERISHLQQSVDAIAVEVERVSEGQRFTTKLLADRTPAGRGERS